MSHDAAIINKNIVVELTEPVLLEEHRKKMAKMKRVILDSVKDHFIPHIIAKAIGKDMFDAIVTLYQSDNVNQKMLLQNKLRSTCTS
jgi:hypothetical protein